MLSLGIVCTTLLLAPMNAAAQDDTETESPLDSPFLVEPKTPADLFEAARISTQLARPTLARQYIARLLEVADDAAILQIRDEFGVAELLRLATIKDLRPESQTLLKRSNAAFRAQSEDPSRVAAILRGLQGSPTDRAVSLESIRAAGPNIIGNLLNVLADDSQADLHEPITTAMTQLQSDAVPAIRAGIDSPNIRVRTSCLVALGYLGDRGVVPYLWHPAFAPGVPTGVRSAARKSLQQLLARAPNRPRQITNIGASDDLYNEALTYLSGSSSWVTDADNNVTLWSWVGGKLTGSAMTPETASEQTGARLARDAMELDPTSLKKQALYLTFALARDSRQAGWDQRLPAGTGTAQDLGLSLGGELLSHTLEIALDHDSTHAARGALATIWQVGGNRTQGTRPSQITRALSHRDQRIQLAAANAILNLSPGRDFPGSTQVVSILSRALRTDGTVKCLVIDPNSDRANAMATLMGDLGYQTTVAATGRQGFRTAADRGDISLVAVNANTVQWALSGTIANLRADSRTAGLPIVIYGPAFAEAQLTTTLSQYDEITFIEETEQTGEGARRFVNLKLKPFLESTLPKLSDTELTAHRELAAAWFAQLAGPRRQSPVDLNIAQSALTDGVDDEAVARQCIAALGAIPNAGVQFRLQEFAINEGLPQTTRLFAINELAFHIQRNTVMLGVQEQLDIIKLARALENTELSAPAAALAGSMQPTVQQTFRRLQRYQPR